MRQGDPFSPPLFCLTDEDLSGCITWLMDSNKLQHMSGPKGCKTPSHILYDDDIMIFLQWNLERLEKFDGYVCRIWSSFRTVSELE